MKEIIAKEGKEGRKVSFLFFVFLFFRIFKKNSLVKKFVSDAAPEGSLFSMHYSCINRLRLLRYD